MEHNEPIAQLRARFVLTEAYAREMYRSIRSRALIILGIILIGPVFVYCITKIAWRAIFSYITGAAFLEGVSMWLAVALLLAYVAGLIWLLFSPRRRAKRLIRRMGELYGTPTELRVAFHAEALRIQMRADDTGLSLAWPIFDKCLETPNLFLLVTKEKQVFPVAKQGLIDVNPADLRKWIDWKCPNAKRNWRSAE